ncbi:hypothetical protein AMECASPLE_010644 [Ameca splendens]|uniref:Secreted protein n=1 Tax=Ameca splendens TaxID=208324 RepID=A0ABV0XDM0_9TELE
MNCSDIHCYWLIWLIVVSLISAHNSPAFHTCNWNMVKFPVLCSNFQGKWNMCGRRAFLQILMSQTSLYVCCLCSSSCFSSFSFFLSPSCLTPGWKFSSLGRGASHPHNLADKTLSVLPLLSLALTE